MLNKQKITCLNMRTDICRATCYQGEATKRKTKSVECRYSAELSYKHDDKNHVFTNVFYQLFFPLMFTNVFFLYTVKTFCTFSSHRLSAKSIAIQKSLLSLPGQRGAWRATRRCQCCLTRNAFSIDCTKL